MNALLLLLALPVVLQPERKQRGGLRYFFVSLLFVMIYKVAGISSALYFSQGALFLFVVDTGWGRVNFAPFLVLLSLSPLLGYASEVFTYPIRVQLSETAGWLFSQMQIPIFSKGSLFILADGTEFQVDTACIGIRMLNTGLCMGLLSLAFAERRSNKRLGAGFTLLVLWITFGLVLLSNLFRIMALVYFRIPPGSVWHDGAGLLALLLYVVMPIYGTCKLMVREYGRAATFDSAEKKKAGMPARSIPLLTLLVLVSLVFFPRSDQQSGPETFSGLSVPGFELREEFPGVLCGRNPDALLYVKAIDGPLRSGHPPQICWTANGFKLSHFYYGKVLGKRIAFGVLKKGDIVQYTAWWHDNGAYQTADDLEWRWKWGPPFYTVNITCSSEKELKEQLVNFLTENPIAQNR